MPHSPAYNKGVDTPGFVHPYISVASVFVISSCVVVSGHIEQLCSLYLVRMDL